MTKYFLAYAVSEIFRDNDQGAKVFTSFKLIYQKNRLPDFIKIFSDIAKNTALDLNAEVIPSDEDGVEAFDYKSSLKSPNWSRQMAAKLVASYKKDVNRKKATAIDVLVAPLLK